jgi:hypothetical protein
MSVGEGNGIDQAQEVELIPYIIIISEEGVDYSLKETGKFKYHIKVTGGGQERVFSTVNYSPKAAIGFIESQRQSDIPKGMDGDYTEGDPVLVGKEILLERDPDAAEPFMGSGTYLFTAMRDGQNSVFTSQGNSLYEAMVSLLRKYGEERDNGLWIVEEIPKIVARLGPVLPGTFDIDAKDEEDAVKRLVANFADEYIRLCKRGFVSFRPIMVEPDEETGYSGLPILEKEGRELYIEKTTGLLLDKGWNEGNVIIKIKSDQDDEEEPEPEPDPLLTGKFPNDDIPF